MPIGLSFRTCISLLISNSRTSWKGTGFSGKRGFRSCDHGITGSSLSVNTGNSENFYDWVSESEGTGA